MEIEEVGIMAARTYYSVDSQSYKEKKRKLLLKELRKKKIENVTRYIYIYRKKTILKKIYLARI